jgi:hypothetical protein
MNDQQCELEVLDVSSVVPTLIDSVVKVYELHGLTHFVFAVSQPTIAFKSQRIERLVATRLIVPTGLRQVIGMAIVDGHPTRDPAPVEWLPRAVGRC